MDTKTKRHPIRGFFYGIFFGLGLALIVVGQGIAALGTWPPFIALIVGIIVGTLWSTYGPAKAPKGPPPTGAVLADEPSPSPEPAAVATAGAPFSPDQSAEADPATSSEEALSADSSEPAPEVPPAPPDAGAESDDNT